MQLHSTEAGTGRTGDSGVALNRYDSVAAFQNGSPMPSLDPDEADDTRLERMIERARDASALLKALSHESRLLMLCMLCQGERTVSEIEHFLGMQQAVVSQQLARLRMDRIVQTRREGRQIYYSIVDPQLAELLSVLYKMYCDPAGKSALDRREQKA